MAHQELNEFKSCQWIFQTLFRNGSWKVGSNPGEGRRIDLVGVVQVVQGFILINILKILRSYFFKLLFKKICVEPKTFYKHLKIKLNYGIEQNEVILLFEFYPKSINLYLNWIWKDPLRSPEERLDEDQIPRSKGADKPTRTVLDE